MSNNVTIRVLSIYLLFTASASLIIIATASSTTSSENVITVPPRAYNAEEATVTAAPELKRQDSTNYCTEWSIVDGNNFSYAVVMNPTYKYFRRSCRLLCA
jgi:hypothetical protein